MSNELVSVIVPIYNVERYLNKCLDSISRQTYSNLEIILINDGSTDDSLRICENYKMRDDRIKVINKKNGGVSSSRNIGLKHATGKYLTFIDSDDYVDKRMIEIMLKILKEKNADIVICNTRNVYEESDFATSQNDIFDTVKYNNVEALKCIFNEKPFNAVCWGKLYKKSLFDDLYFDENIKIAEDLDILYKIFFYSNSIYYISAPLYNWTVRNDSAIHCEYNKDWEGEILVCDRIIEFTRIKCPKITNYAIKRYLRIVIYCIDKSIDNNLKLEYLIGCLKKYNLKFSKNYIKFYLKYIFIKFFSKLYIIIRRVNKNK